MTDKRTTPFCVVVMLYDSVVTYECTFPFNDCIPLSECPFSAFPRAANREAGCEHFDDGQCISRAARKSARKAPPA